MAEKITVEITEHFSDFLRKERIRIAELVIEEARTNLSSMADCGCYYDIKSMKAEELIDKWEKNGVINKQG